MVSTVLLNLSNALAAANANEVRERKANKSVK